MIDMDRSIVQQYLAGGEALRKSVAGLTMADLQWSPPKDANVGLWTIQQVIIHIADAEAAFVDRIKRIVAMDEPALMAWDENKYIERLHYESQSVEDAVMLINLTRRQLTKMLNQLPDADFERAGQHNERSRQTLAMVLGFANWHLDHHLKFVLDKRKLLEK
jgi:uncharacterized damage-inducible protein DinB